MYGHESQEQKEVQEMYALQQELPKLIHRYQYDAEPSIDVLQQKYKQWLELANKHMRQPESIYRFQLQLLFQISDMRAVTFRPNAQQYDFVARLSLSLSETISEDIKKYENKKRREDNIDKINSYLPSFVHGILNRLK